MNIDWDASAQDNINTLIDHMLGEKLGPMMVAEVVRNCPKDTGKLAESTDMQVDRDKHVLYITATGDETREGGEKRKYYAAWVDLGHRIIAWGNDTGKTKAPTAYMRKALYRKYPGF